MSIKEISKKVKSKMTKEKVAVEETAEIQAEEVPKKMKKDKKRKAVVLESEATVTPASSTETAVESKVEEAAPKKAAKREKKAKVAKPATEEVVKDTVAKDKATLFLASWKHDRESWKFEKNRQSWILKNMFNAEQVRLLLLNLSRLTVSHTISVLNTSLICVVITRCGIRLPLPRRLWRNGRLKRRRSLSLKLLKWPRRLKGRRK
jgi:hypothetical protein